ncbi:MAG: GTPase Era [Clostridia bacterium]|nr:GTPase Era [Clostridia bacterium]
MEKECKKSLFVSIVGRPNVGKSSLLNMLVGEKISIVSPKPQTTRNKIIGILTKENTQIVFTDTPGMLRPKNKLGNYMLGEINNSFSGAEAIIHVVEAGKNVHSDDVKFIEKFKKIGVPVILAINKIDTLKQKSDIIKNIKEYSELMDYESIVPVSAITSDGYFELLCEILKLAKPSVFFYDEDDITDQTQRTIAAEIIREKMLYLLDQELPHGVAIFIEKFQFRSDNEVDISALIQCERSNHKAIIIGHRGQMIKKIGTLSRQELEEMMSCKVNLKLWVKVKENWRNSDAVLRDMGYMLEKN